MWSLPWVLRLLRDVAEAMWLVPVTLGKRDGLQGSLPLVTVTLLVLGPRDTDKCSIGQYSFYCRTEKELCQQQLKQAE